MTESNDLASSHTSSFSESNSDFKEFHFEPVALNDVILHFKDASFFLHSHILSHGSKYFEAALTGLTDGGNQACSRTAKCGAGQTRCLALPDSLGGADYTVQQLHDFLSQLCDHSLVPVVVNPRTTASHSVTARQIVEYFDSIASQWLNGLFRVPTTTYLLQSPVVLLLPELLVV